MASVLWILLAFSYCSNSVRGELVIGFLKKTVEVPVPSGPVQSTALTLIRPRSPGVWSQVVARRVNGVWIGENSSIDRVENSLAGVSLKDLNYNDNGLYEFSGPGDERISNIQLDVVPFFNNDVSVSEGETGTLPCYSVTLGSDVKFLQWDKHNQTFLKLNVSDGKVEYGAGHEGRASVPGWRSGDLTLILEKVQQEDQGEYYCSVLKGTAKERGNPAAVRLTVQHLTTPSGPPVTGTTAGPASEKNNWWMIFCVVVPLLVCIIIILLGCILHVLRRPSRQGNNTGPTENDFDVDDEKSTLS